jgi:hypothetical protein
MSDRHQDLELRASPERARELVVAAGEELGWQVVDERDSVLVRERRRRLSGQWPVGIRVSIARASREGRSRLRLWGRVGGFGPFVAERLKQEMESFESRLRALSSAGYPN